jgi:dienelactone hydrolase
MVKKGFRGMATRVFIHGLESTSQGTKGVYLRTRYPDMIVEDFLGDLDERMAKLRALLADRTDLILVGSSYGGLMAALYACENEGAVRRLVLLAPALDLEAFAPCRRCRLTIPVTLYHGSRDDVVPPDAVRAIALEVFTRLDYRRVDDDHPLRETFPTLDWDTLLRP